MAKRTQTYYLTRDVSKTVQDLSQLAGWEREVAGVLLSVSSETDKAEAIRALLPIPDHAKNEAKENEEITQTTLDLLPRSIKNRAKIFLIHFLPRVKVLDGGSVELEGGQQAGALIDIVRFFCSPVHLKIPPPQGYEGIIRFFKSYPLPQSAFAPGRQSNGQFTPYSSLFPVSAIEDVRLANSKRNGWIIA